MSLFNELIEGDGLAIPSRAEPLKLKDQDAITEWLSREADQWNLLSRTADFPPLRGTVFHTIFSDQTNDFRTAINHLNTAFAGNQHSTSARNNLEQFLQKVSKGTIPLSESRTGQLIFEIADLREQEGEEEPATPVIASQGDMTAAAGLLMIAREQGLPVMLNRNSTRDVVPEITAILRGWERSHAVQAILSAEEAGFGKLRDRLEIEFQNTASALKADADGLRENVDTISANIRAENASFAKEMEDRRKKMAAYEETLRTKLATESAVDLWRSSAETNFWRGVVALGCFVVLGAIGVLALVFNISWITEQLGEDPGFASLTVVTLPALALAWAMRLASRVFVQSSNAQRDAETRQAQVETYLALAQDEKLGVTDTERILILNALFRPSGASPDDDAPPPNLIELLTRQGKAP